jgi:hypothetical protein
MQFFSKMTVFGIFDATQFQPTHLTSTIVLLEKPTVAQPHKFPPFCGI